VADLLQTLISAVVIGSLYALIALGYTMVYGILKLINFAHSDVVVLGAWVSFTLATGALPLVGVPTDGWWYGGMVLLLAMGICALIGFGIERLAYRPIRKAPRLNALITAIGVSLFLQNSGQLQWNFTPKPVELAAGNYEMGGGNDKFKLPAAVKIDDGRDVRVRIQPAASATNANPSPVDLKVISPPGEYKQGDELQLERTIGRSQARGATFTLVSASAAQLKLPFGAMPAGVPALVPDKPLYEHTFYTSGPPDGDGNPTVIAKPVRIELLHVIILATAASLMVGLEVLVHRTKFGTAMRAVSFNTDNAALMGVPVDRVISVTFMIGAALAAAAGFLYAVNYKQIQQPAHGTWVLLGLKAFVAAVVGGIGNLRGAVIGGFLIAFIEQFGAVYGRYAIGDSASAMTDVYVFVLLILVLLFKPSGILGKTVREKV
jgi:branched-chain amino acid transport system permease protein